MHTRQRKFYRLLDFRPIKNKESATKILITFSIVSFSIQCLPATGQVTAPEGEYLAHLLNVGNFTVSEYDGELLLPPKVDKLRARPNDFVAGLVTSDDDYVAPFQFLDLGILAVSFGFLNGICQAFCYFYQNFLKFLSQYTGRVSALAQMKVDQSHVQASGPLSFGLWRGVYWAKQASMRNRVLVLLDWVKTRWFGRDVTEIA
jgi:NADH dehydrogenase FAD-containing subunit